MVQSNYKTNFLIMNKNIIVLNKQIELFISDFFVSEQENIDRNLRDYLIERLDSLVNASRVDLTLDEFKKSFINVCEKHGILDKISDDKEKSKQMIEDLIENKLTLDSSLIFDIEDHFQKSIKSNKDLNVLYEKNWFNRKEEKTNTVLNLFKINKDIDIKEMVGVVNTFIENSDLDFEEKKPNIKSIVRNINQTSIASEPFKIEDGKIQYQRSNAGEFDFFMYNKKDNSYSISMSTKSQTTKIEGSSPFRHAIAMYYIVAKAYESSERLKNNNLSQREHILEFENQIAKMDDFRPYKLNESRPREKELKPDKIKRNIKSITGNTDLVIKEFINMGVLDKSIIKDVSESEKHTSYMMNKSHLDKIKKYIGELGAKCNVFYFGDVISSNKKENTYSNEYTNEEIRAAANIFAYTNVGNVGFGGLNLTPTASTDFCEDLKVRFNTSTDKNKRCVDLTMLNKNITKIVGVIVDKFTQFDSCDDILQYYDKNSDKKENFDVLENITNIELNIIDMISEEIDTGSNPDQAYLSTMTRFSVTPKLNVNEFLINMQKKYRLINTSMVREGLSKLELLDNKIDKIEEDNNSEKSFKLVLKTTFEAKTLKISLDLKGDKISKKDYDSEIEKIDNQIDDIYKTFQKSQSMMSNLKKNNIK